MVKRGRYICETIKGDELSILAIAWDWNWRTELRVREAIMKTMKLIALKTAEMIC